MSSEGFFEVALGQRACRSFSADPVPDADLQRMLEAAVHAPSAQNSQPWVLVVVRDPRSIARLAELTRRLWSGGARASVSADLEPRILRDLDRYVERGLGGAPLVVVVGVDTAAVHPASAGSSVFPAVQNLCLAAIALGYGSALTSLTVQAAGPVRELLGLPAHVDPVAAVPIGRPARPLGPPRRLPLVARAHRERFGVPWEPEPG